MNTTSTPTLVKIEDHEGNGICGHCDREGLRWICTLSDGSAVGTECAKRVMGWKPAPKSYNWVGDFTAIAEKIECAGTSSEVVWVLWQHKQGNQTRETRGGSVSVIGGARQDWIRRGWVEA